MGYYSKSQKDEILASIYFPDIVMRYQELRGQEGRYDGICPNPEHDDRNFGNCKFYSDHGYCFACHRAFDAIDYLKWQDPECNTVGDALDKLVAQFNLKIVPVARGNKENKDEKITGIFLNKQERELLGFELENKSYVPVRMLGETDYFFKKEKLQKKSSFRKNARTMINGTYKKPNESRSDIGGNYFEYERIINPWGFLSLEEQAEMIAGKCREKFLYYRQLELECTYSKMQAEETKEKLLKNSYSRENAQMMDDVISLYGSLSREYSKWQKDIERIFKKVTPYLETAKGKVS